MVNINAGAHLTSYVESVEEALKASARLGVCTEKDSIERTRNGKSLTKICAALTHYGDTRVLGQIISWLEESD
eukprot:CAMPEP_0114343330 /NCGR_PEP_ID=MMETSP0101-20121206/10515_1 /TAXON_ID=38822 ORGANISM="Pteridomonas danica, Strain PT" /NCGR_SAMPLE_ID=MMETSP0101 /ASSEMBLY_ACC=CAM_ASM_000211 /LENGTH=72 /DNA_ID=CAMNT_0001477977 /DNA_START=302 /DNA_END=520 /DNA_ORIENTATION=+